MITQIVSGNLISKLKNLGDKSREFHKLYVRSWDYPLVTSREFQNFRCLYLNRTKEEFQDIFVDDKTTHMLINILQISFILQKEMKGTFDEKFFDFFFFASCFLIIKLEHPKLFKKLKVKVCDLDINLKIIFDVETLIMNKIDWKLNLCTCKEIQTLLINAITENYESERRDLDELVSDWINFCLFEYKLYNKYDQLILTLACVSISLEDRKSVILIERFHFISENLVDRVCLNECKDNIRMTLNEEEINNSEQDMNDEHLILNINTKENTNSNSPNKVSNIPFDRLSPLLQTPHQESMSTNISYSNLVNLEVSCPQKLCFNDKDENFLKKKKGKIRIKTKKSKKELPIKINNKIVKSFKKKSKSLLN